MPNKISDYTKITLQISWKILSILLAIVILGMFAMWRPWTNETAAVRKISVSGEATIKAVPDEYTLSPYFEFANTDRTKAAEELTTQSKTITAKLKELGVKEEQIKSSTNDYDRYGFTVPESGTSSSLQLQYTITVTDKDIAQKVQDYLLTLKPKGQISPYATFSEAKKKELQVQARDKAIEDAKDKATKTASQFGAKVGKVITVTDGASYGGPIAYDGVSTLEAKADATSSVPVQPGQNDFSYSVSVEYELK